MEKHLLQRYGSIEGAAAYRRKYERTWLRRLSNRRELAIVHRALAQAGTSGRALDCPCGAGRLVPVLLRHADTVVGADRSPAMVDEARDALAALLEAGTVELVVAPVEELPFDDGAFDTVVCHRLIHHVPGASDRDRILRELARVARRRVVLSFNDETTWKRSSQRWRGRRRRRHALSPAALAAEAAAHGLVLEPPVRRLSSLFSLLAVAVFRVEGGGS